LEEKKGKMTVQEAGRKGGLRTSATHGEGFYSEIGRKGGESKTNRTTGAKDRPNPGQFSKTRRQVK
jgi:uncharacterized protein